MSQPHPNYPTNRNRAQGAYSEIRTGVTDELERAVFDFLAEREGEHVRREAIIEGLFGRTVKRSELAADDDDRRIRMAIANLQERGAPIVARAGGVGYIFAPPIEETDQALAEIRSRIEKLQSKAAGLERSKQITRAAYEYPTVARQDSLFDFRGIIGGA